MARPTPAAIGDLNGDGFPDVVAYDASLGVRRWINQGNGSLVASSASPPTSWNYGVLALGDVDLDGDLDLVLGVVDTWCSGSIPSCAYVPPLALWLNSGSGSFSIATGLLPSLGMHPHQIALRDFDGDGDLDLLTSGDNVVAGTGTPAGPLLFLNGGGGVFSQTGIALPAPANFDCFAIGDVNQDGLPDLALDAAPRTSLTCISVSGPVVLLNTGGGSFATVATPSAPRGVPHLVDLNADGTLDLVTITYASATAHLIVANTIGPPVATLPIAVAPSGAFFQLNINHSAAGDLDGDGDQDLVVFTGQGNQVVFIGSPALPVAEVGALAAAWSHPSFFCSARRTSTPTATST